MGLFANFTNKVEKIFGEVQVLKFTSSYQPTSCMAKVNRLSKTNWQSKLIWLGKNVFRTPHAYSRLIVWIFIVTCRHIASNMNNKNPWLSTFLKSQMSTVFYSPAYLRAQSDCLEILQVLIVLENETKVLCAILLRERKSWNYRNMYFGNFDFGSGTRLA